MTKMKGFLSIIIPILVLLPQSDAYCIHVTDSTPSYHQCSDLNAEELPTIVNLYIDSEYPVEDIHLINNNISVIGNTLFTSSWLSRINILRILKSNVEFITIGSFEKLTNLRLLEISDNNLQSFDGTVLQGLENLKTLHLKGNKLESLENICSAATYLEEIIIERNSGEIKTLTANVFKDCKNLKRLHLIGLGIENIDNGFTENLLKLQVLNLTNNYLNNIRFLEANRTLEINSLDVSNNHLTEVEAELFRVSLNKVTTLNLNENYISLFMRDTNVKFTFNLVNLSLTSNKISVINKDLFKYFHPRYFQFLNIDFNPIYKIEPDAFENVRLTSLYIKNSLQTLNSLKKGMFNNLKYLLQLDLSDVNITDIENDTFIDLENLGTIRLENNKIKHLYNGTFSGLKNVKNLNLTNNPVSSIESGAFFGLHNVKELEPKYFFNGIKRIKTRQFEGLSYNYLDELTLSNLGIESLDELAFKGLFDLKRLRLDRNNISNLIENTFVGLDYLEILNVSRNYLVTIDKNAFYKLNKLSSLDLSHNQISVLHEDTFNSLSTLHELDLTNNKLTSVEPGMFKNVGYLRTLLLNDNKITHLKIHAFTGLKNVNEISLFGNHIQKVDSGAFLGLKSYSNRIAKVLKETLELETLEPKNFIGLDGLLHLDFSNKDLKNIQPFAFQGIANLTKLLLNNCSISNISSNAFAGPNITELDLANNNLNNLDQDVFNGSVIGQLNLTGNVLENINFSTFRFVSKLYLYRASVKNLSNSGNYNESYRLKLVDLRDNFITTLEANIFKNMTYLTEIYLSGNPIQVIQENSFYGLGPLKILTLSVNSLIFNLTVFGSLETVHEIAIQNSFINKIETDTFSKTNVTNVNIKNSTILQISSKAFSNMDDLISLHLSNNKIGSIVDEAFYNLPMLKTLDLSNNSLQNIPCFKSNFYHLENLYLNVNKIDSLSPCSFKTLYNVIKLDLSFNSLTEIVKQGIFSPFQNLDSLNMSHNSIKIISDSELYHIRNVKKVDFSYNNLTFSREFSYKSFGVGLWEEFDIRNNPWKCNDLMNMRKTLRSDHINAINVHGEKYYFGYNLNEVSEINNEKNIDGITCRDTNDTNEPTPMFPKTTTSLPNQKLNRH